MAKFDVTWWQTRQYGRVIEADTLEDAWEQCFQNEADNPVVLRYVDDEPYDVEIEEV